MENINTFSKPVIDIVSTGNKIKELRKKSGLSVRNIQDIFGFEYPQAVYAWEQGKNIPTVDNLLVLSQLFGVQIEEMIVVRIIQVELNGNVPVPKKEVGKNCAIAKSA